MLGLRKIDGVYIQSFKEKFGENPIYLYRKEFEKLVQEELLEIDGDVIRLTNKGLDLANLVWEEFVWPWTFGTLLFVQVFEQLGHSFSFKFLKVWDTLLQFKGYNLRLIQKAMNNWDTPKSLRPWTKRSVPIVQGPKV